MSESKSWLRSYVVGAHGGRVDIRVIPWPGAAIIRLLDAADLGAEDPADMIERVRQVAGANGYAVQVTGEPNFYSLGPAQEPYSVRTVTLRRPKTG